MGDFMAKTNYEKVMSVLDDEIKKLQVSELLQESDIVSGKTTLQEAEKLQGERQKKLLLKAIDLQLKDLPLDSAGLKEKLGIHLDGVKKLLKHPDLIQEEHWTALAKISKKLNAYMNEQAPNKIDNEKLVEEQRKRHINKRYNIQEKWLPLK